MVGKRIGRIHIEEEELSQLLGYKGGRIRYIGYMSPYAEIGIVIEHPDMPLVPKGGEIPRVVKSKGGF